MAHSPLLDVRDTDEDWREIGAADPFWGVLTNPQFKKENLDEEAIRIFYDSGVDHVAYVGWELDKLADVQPFHAKRALDFGCGTGRLAEAMGARADEVFGYDISPGMLETARRHSAGKTSYVGELPDGPFDWLNSYIVFQHMPPARGMALLTALLERLAPGGFVSLHFTIWRDDHLQPPAPPPETSGARLLKKVIRSVVPAPAIPKGEVLMYDYDLSRLVETFNRHGVGRMTLAATDHGGHHGVHIFGRREY